MDKRDWTLLVIAAAAGESVQPVQLQKALFLLGQNLSGADLKVKDFYHFMPYDYGPFCSDIYQDAESLSDKGLVHIDEPPYQSYKVYSITDRGKRHAQEMERDLKKEVRMYMKDVVKWVRSLSFQQLVRSIYRHYPKMRVNSVFQG
jgi:uncharacterized protein YwgA